MLATAVRGTASSRIHANCRRVSHVTSSPVPRPRYVERGGELSSRPPAVACDVRMYSFVVEADRDLLDAYCERCFTRPSDGDERWHAAGRHILVNFVDIPLLRSA